MIQILIIFYLDHPKCLLLNLWVAAQVIAEDKLRLLQLLDTLLRLFFPFPDCRIWQVEGFLVCSQKVGDFWDLLGIHLYRLAEELVDVLGPNFVGPVENQ